MNLEERIRVLEDQVAHLTLRISALEAKYNMYGVYGPIVTEKDGYVTHTYCSCPQHKSGELTGGWICPRHGQQF